MSSTHSAHATTIPHEQLSDISASVDNSPPSTVVRDLSTTPRQQLSSILPPLIFGTATFNYQFNPDPYALHPNEIVQAAFTSGIRAFDTSPYYGPAEQILGDAIHSSQITSSPTLSHLTRSDYFILTKCGRIAADVFDYNPSWIRHSVERSLRRFRTTYLDVVYLHDVEFVSPEEVLGGIRALRSIRDENSSIRYVGICGYPVDTLCSLAELIVNETGEPLDIVQSYANYTIQNQRLLTKGLKRLVNAGVDVIPNASPLGMGLCRSQGVPVGSMGNWHPSPDALRSACLDAANWVQREQGEKLETVAVRFAMENWLTTGAAAGSHGPTPKEATAALQKRVTASTHNSTSDEATIHDVPSLQNSRFGVSVMGVSKLSELDDTMAVYNAIVSAACTSPDQQPDETSQKTRSITAHIREHILGPKWTDFAWESPDVGFVNKRGQLGVRQEELDQEEKVGAGAPVSTS